jgi:hypothetical protein
LTAGDVSDIVPSAAAPAVISSVVDMSPRIAIEKHLQSPFDNRFEVSYFYRISQVPNSLTKPHDCDDIGVTFLLAIYMMTICSQKFVSVGAYGERMKHEPLWGLEVCN